jgi:hypothetical protein
MRRWLVVGGALVLAVTAFAIARVTSGGAPTTARASESPVSSIAGASVSLAALPSAPALPKPRVQKAAPSTPTSSANVTSSSGPAAAPAAQSAPQQSAPVVQKPAPQPKQKPKTASCYGPLC